MTILVRAIGPSLIPFGIADAVANPTLEIFDVSNTRIAPNDNRKTTQVGGIITGDQFAEINGSGLAPGNGPIARTTARTDPFWMIKPAIINLSPGWIRPLVAMFASLAVDAALRSKASTTPVPTVFSAPRTTAV